MACKSLEIRQYRTKQTKEMKNEKYIKGAIYAIACLGPYDYNQYGGKATYLGEIDAGDNEFDTLYKFTLENGRDTAWFTIADIIGELK